MHSLLRFFFKIYSTSFFIKLRSVGSPLRFLLQNLLPVPSFIPIRGGYPDNGCGDVVAFALRGAGYDLMELANEDISLHMTCRSVYIFQDFLLKC